MTPSHFDEQLLALHRLALNLYHFLLYHSSYKQISLRGTRLSRLHVKEIRPFFTRHNLERSTRIFVQGILHHKKETWLATIDCQATPLLQQVRLDPQQLYGAFSVLCVPSCCHMMLPCPALNPYLEFGDNLHSFRTV